jgi:hypothetical protein
MDGHKDEVTTAPPQAERARDAWADDARGGTAKLEGRELDFAVAQKVFGWRWMVCCDDDAVYTSFIIEPDRDPPGHPHHKYREIAPIRSAHWTAIPNVPRYSADPAADYAVLKHVRETWGIDEVFAFLNALQAAQSKRMRGASDNVPHGLSWQLFYEPGDYSRAAVSARRAAGGDQGTKG